MKSLSIQPSGSLDALGALGVLRDGGGVLVSYLLFEPGFVQALMTWARVTPMPEKTNCCHFLTRPEGQECDNLAIATTGDDSLETCPSW